MAKKKAQLLRLNQKYQLLDYNEKDFSLRRQCEVLNLNRSSIYYQPRPENPYHVELMNLIDEKYTDMPYYGVPRMTEHLRQSGHVTGPKLVRRLMRQMGLEAIYPKPKMSKRHPEHKIYPYLLKDVKIKRPNHVWSTDITYIRLRNGFAYLVAIIDWFSRCVLSWRLSNSLDVDFCLDCLDEAVHYYGTPDIFNTDQGSQFTSIDFTERLKNNNITISMDGRGRVFDNIFVERLWRTVKYEDIYIHDYQTIPQARSGLGDYFPKYNTKRLHSSLNYQTPWNIYTTGICLN
jgi:putative transposase